MSHFLKHKTYLLNLNCKQFPLRTCCCLLQLTLFQHNVCHAYRASHQWDQGLHPRSHKMQMEPVQGYTFTNPDMTVYVYTYKVVPQIIMEVINTCGKSLPYHSLITDHEFSDCLTIINNTNSDIASCQSLEPCSLHIQVISSVLTSILSSVELMAIVWLHNRSTGRKVLLTRYHCLWKSGSCGTLYDILTRGKITCWSANPTFKKVFTVVRWNNAKDNCRVP